MKPDTNHEGLNKRVDVAFGEYKVIRRSLIKGMPGYSVKGNYYIIELGMVDVLKALWMSSTLRNYTILIADEVKEIE